MQKVGGKLAYSYFGEGEPQSDFLSEILRSLSGFILDKTITVNFTEQIITSTYGRLTHISNKSDPPLEKMKATVDAVASHGIDVFLNRQMIYNCPELLPGREGQSGDRQR